MPAAPPSFPLSAEIREYLSLTIQLLGALAWPATVALILWSFRSVIVDAVRKSRETVLKIGGAEIHLSSGEATDALTDVFAEIDVILRDHLKDSEKQLFLKILGYVRPPTVEELLPGFERGSNEHGQLRALRGVYYVRPVEGGTWKANKHVEVTTLGRLVARHKSRQLESNFLSAND